ncbi:MAG: CRTAC1 family protein [Acidobacteriota bacterium]
MLAPPAVTLRTTTLLVAGTLSAPLAFSSQPLERFRDVTKAAGITFVHDQRPTPEKHMSETFGSGVAWIDFDNDGYQDLYFVNGAPGSSNVLYRNNGDGTFTDVTARAGLAMADPRHGHKTGVAVGDFDNDGYADIYVGAFGPNALFRNNGDGTFTDVTARAGVAGGAAEWTSSVGFFDFDRDGRLDIYVTNYLDVSYDDNPYCGFKREGFRTYCSPTIFDGVADRLFRNNGDGTFTDVSVKAGIANPAGKGLGVTFCDVDDDGLVDIYVANDLVRNFLYRNNGDGTFRDIAYAAGVGFGGDGKPQAGMGTDCGDVDGDGRPDLYVTNFSEELNALYVNRGRGLFEDATIRLGLRSGYGPLGFGTKLFDMDNDGDLDIHVVNGHIVDNIELYGTGVTYRMKDLLYENVGGRFVDVSARSGAALLVDRVGRGQAVADFDNDGHLDIVISNLGGPAVLLKGTGVQAGNWLSIRAAGRKSNPHGLGARVTVETPAGRQVREINNVASYLSANDLRLHVGLGTARTATRVEIRWPSGQVQTLTNVAANQVLTITEP